MELIYKDKKTKEKCTNIKKAKKEFDIKVVEKLFGTIYFLQNAKNLQDIANVPSFHLHQLKGDKKGSYSIYLGKVLGYRLIIKPLDDNKEEIKNHDDLSLIYKSTKIVLIWEVSNHYDD